ncbi:hypothetical protein BD410DRAFT_799311 [Rickenella mellea]|uniref:Fungal-type protein kinase domain-containing protein n=1 Tax=Rickenella mellea TaxID=50990 RepID=A0A4Y7QKK1_9AGAM|nr:hypothetical protein BD410DRAFT_799311 [Rickenella mellea]
MAQPLPFNNTSKMLNPVCATLGIFHQYYDWVHRDNSTGSILFYEARGNLTDLEYTTHQSTEGTHDAQVRTGTINFMSTEVASGYYLHTSYSSHRRAALAALRTAENADLIDRLLADPFYYYALPETLVLAERPPFRHNHLHDMESMWWTACWFFFFHGIRAEDGGNNDHDLQKQLEDARELFPGTLKGGIRQSIFGGNSNIHPYRANLHKEFRIAVSALDDLREELSDRYTHVECPGNIERIGSLSAEPAEVHQKFKKVFLLAAFVHAKTQIAPLRTLLGPRWEDVPMVKPSIQTTDKKKKTELRRNPKRKAKASTETGPRRSTRKRTRRE